MQVNQQKSPAAHKQRLKTSNFKTHIRCFATVIMRCICPYEEQLDDICRNNRDKLRRGCFFFVLSLLLGLSRLNAGMLPFGLAILCVSGKSNVIFCLSGCAAACLFEGMGGIIQFITFFLIFLLRKNITSDRFDEALLPRLVTALFSGLFIGSCTLFSNGVSAGLLLTFFTYIILSVGCVYLFSGCLTDNEKKSNSLYLISVYSLCVCVIPALQRLSFSSIDFALIFSSFASLWICKCKGPVYGCVAGFIFGFACPQPLFSAPLGLSCLAAGYLMTKNLPLAILSFPVCSFFIYAYLFGLSEISTFLAFTISGSLLYLAFHDRLPTLSFITAVAERQKSVKPRSKKGDFERVSDSLSGLSSVIYKFAEHMKAPSGSEAQQVIEKAFSEVCEGCSLNGMCYAKRQCNLPSVMAKIISTLHSRKITEDELHELLLCKCIKVKDLCGLINLRYSELHFLTMKANRTQTVASLYNSMSRLMRTTSRQEDEKNVRDEALERSISEALKKIGVEFSTVTATGTRSKDIYIHGIRADKIPCSSKELAEYLSGECRIKLLEPVFDISDNADMIMKLSRSGIIQIDYAQASRAKDGEDVNGDTVCFFENEGGYFYSIIADGMGSGKTAAATSRLSCVFLEKMLMAGTTKNICIEMLNNLLLSKNDETFSGIDLLEIDKLSGSAYFIKAGAAPSFVLRHSRLYKICSETPPVGIIPSFSAESTRFSLEKGDVIFMVSDGAVDSDADAVWLSQLIEHSEGNEPAFLAKEIIERAAISARHDDDASACVIRIN